MPILALIAACDSRWAPADTGAVEVSEPPQVYLTSPPDASAWAAGAPIPVAAVISDDVDTPSDLVVEIRSDRDGVVATPVPSPDGLLSTTVQLTEGVHLVTVRATDLQGNAGEAGVSISVSGTTISQPAVAIEPAAPVTGEALAASLAAEAMHRDGAALTYTWSWMVDGADAGIGDALVPGDLVVRGQTWEATLTATDGVSTSPPARRAVAVGNAPPLTTVSLSPVNPLPGEDLTCAWDPVADAEGDAVSESVAWTVDGADAGVTEPILTGQRRGDEVRCTLTLDDGTDTVAIPSNAVRVGNGAPSLGTASIAPSTATEASTLTCIGGSLADPDGDPVTLSTRWFVDGAEVSTASRIDGTTFSRDQSVVCEVTPADAWSAGAPVTSPPLVVQDTPPGVPEVAFLVERAVSGETVECAVVTEAGDADGDPVTYTWSWDLDGVVQIGTDPSFDTDGAPGGSALTCTATATDGTLAGGSSSASLVLLGPTTGVLAASDAGTLIVSTTASASLGKSVDAVGDVDGDGADDLLVTAPGGSGAAYVFGSATLAAGGTLDETAALAGWTGTAGINFGGGRAGTGGDFDGDTVGDVVIGAPLDDAGGKDAGRAWVLYGGAWGLGDPVDDDADATIAGATGAWLTTRMAAADLDGDGTDDLVLAGPYHDGGADKTGAAFVFLGGARLAGTLSSDDADATVTGADAEVELGWALAAGGDGDHDGYADLAVGVFDADPGGVSDAGTAAFISGGDLRAEESHDRLAYLLVNGVSAAARVGYDVAAAGDIDADGVGDLLVGAYLDDAAGGDAGSAAIVYGRAGMNREIDVDDADARFYGEEASDQYGAVLAPLGDFDDDGFADWIAGAPTGSGGGDSSAGAAYVYLGRSRGSWGSAGADADLRIYGDAGDDRAGDELAGGLDLTGDGYGDFAVGAQGAGTGGTVYVFSGP